MKKLLTFLLVVALLAGSLVYTFRQWRLRSVPSAAWRCLQQPQQMILYSIHPEEAESAMVGAQLFHGHRILGQVSVSAPTDRQRIAHSIKGAVLHFPDPEACFNPRHALRLRNGHDTYDLLICFECGAMEVFNGDKPVGSTGIGGPPDTLDSILLAAKVPLADAHEH